MIELQVDRGDTGWSMMHLQLKVQDTSFPTTTQWVILATLSPTCREMEQLFIQSLLELQTVVFAFQMFNDQKSYFTFQHWCGHIMQGYIKAGYIKVTERSGSDQLGC